MDSTGLVTVDQDTIGTSTAKVEYTHNAVTAFSSDFAVTVACGTLTTSAFSGSPFNYLTNSVATGVRASVITGTSYVSNPSSGVAGCATITYVV